MPKPGESTNHLRRYLVLITLVIGGILVLLLINNDQSGFSITSAIIDNVRNRSLGNVIDNNKNFLTGDTVTDENLLRNTPRFNFILSSDKIPIINKLVSIERLDLKSLDLAANIKVNGDKLELSKIQEINLNLAGFSGRIGFDETFFSIDGKAKRLEINGIALSSDREISISFEGLEYQQASFENINLDNVQFVGGSGKLEIVGSLDYRLEEDQSITIYQYFGKLNLNNEGGNSTIAGSVFDGVSEGLDIIGESLDLNLR